MLELLPSLLELCHLLLHLLVSLVLIIQLFFELLNATNCLPQSPCHVCTIWDVVRCICGRPILVYALHYIAEHATNK